MTKRKKKKKCFLSNLLLLTRDIPLYDLKLQERARSKECCLNDVFSYIFKLATNCLSVFDHFVGLALKLSTSNIVTLRCDLPHMQIFIERR